MTLPPLSLLELEDEEEDPRPASRLELGDEGEYPEVGEVEEPVEEWRRIIAISDWEAERPGELTLVAGQMYYVYGVDVTREWYEVGTMDGDGDGGGMGWVPLNLCKLVDE